MRLAALLDALPPELAPRRLHGAGAVERCVVRGIQVDSRQVVPGDLFVALRGSQADGHDFLPQAIGAGASALLVETASEVAITGDSVVIEVPDTRRALAPLATAFFGRPADELRLVGITGTNGKTSVTYLVESMLAAAGLPSGLIGTVEIRFAAERWRSVNTTPESVDLQRTLRAMCTQGIRDVVMEVSSHGLELGRVEGCQFDVAAITNLTPEHLDFHGTMEAYGESKARLFRDYLRPGATAIVNVDMDGAERFETAAREAGARILTTSGEPGSTADVVIEDAEVRLTGSRVHVRLPGGNRLDIELPLLGEFNLENLRVALAVAHALDLPPHAQQQGVAEVPQVPGRIERVVTGRPAAPTVLVDYAHTPDALEKLLRTVRPLARGRLVTVFGCGGDRDRSKRPQMAEAVARYSDRVVATSDNPRTEDPAAILADVERGLSKLRKQSPEDLAAATDETDGRYCIEPDRRRAIALAIRAAGPDDTVVIAGKGHEDYQIVGRERLPFDDRREARRQLEALER